MDSSASRVGLGESNCEAYSHNPLSKLKTYGFALAIIVGIDGLAVGGAGLAGYFQVGALSNLSQVHALIMMTTGGGGGTLLLIIGVVGLVKNRQKSNYQQHGRDLEHDNPTRKSNQTSNEEIIQSIDTRGLVCGRATWRRVWRVEVLDVVPRAPVIDWNAKDPFFHQTYRENYALLYIPRRVRVNSEEKDLTLQTFIEISKGPFDRLSSKVYKKFENSAAPGWVLMSKKVIPDSRNKNYETQKNMIEKELGFRMPHLFEAVVLNLMIFASTGERLYRLDPITYTRCIEKVDGQYPVVVGGFGSDGLDVLQRNNDFITGHYGVAVVQKF